MSLPFSGTRTLGDPLRKKTASELTKLSTTSEQKAKQGEITKQTVAPSGNNLLKNAAGYAGITLVAFLMNPVKMILVAGAGAGLVYMVTKSPVLAAIAAPVTSFGYTVATFKGF
jgi:hypothetical protein